MVVGETLVVITQQSNSYLLFLKSDSRQAFSAVSLFSRGRQKGGIESLGAGPSVLSSKLPLVQQAPPQHIGFVVGTLGVCCVAKLWCV